MGRRMSAWRVALPAVMMIGQVPCLGIEPPKSDRIAALRRGLAHKETARRAAQELALVRADDQETIESLLSAIERTNAVSKATPDTLRQSDAMLEALVAAGERAVPAIVERIRSARHRNKAEDR